MSDEVAAALITGTFSLLALGVIWLIGEVMNPPNDKGKP